MHECLLCGRNMKKSRKMFGSGCIKNLYEFLNMEKVVKTSEQEKLLTKNLMERENVLKLTAIQRKWFVDRYLTREYLEKLHYHDFKEIKNNVEKDIRNIERCRSIKNVHSLKEIDLNTAYKLYKRQEVFEKNIKMIQENKFEDFDKIKLFLTICSFIFNLSRYKKQYERNFFKKMQFLFWQTVVEVGGKYANFKVAAYFLQHSLDDNAKDLKITDGEVVEIIKKDDCFNNKLNEILKKHNEQNTIDIPLKTEDLIFQNSDLYFGINKAEISIKGVKINDKWNLKIHLHDRYDYSQFKDLKDYYKDTSTIQKSIFSSTLYNLAFFSIKFGVMKEYEIDIYFDINEYEVI